MRTAGEDGPSIFCRGKIMFSQTRKGSTRNSLLALLALALPAGLLAQTGTATISPAFPARGATATITYTSTGGPLAAVSPVYIGLGFNGFQSVTDTAMSGASPTWTKTFTVPANATSIDVYFKNSAATIFDNNGGSGNDWQFVTAETQTADLGVTPVTVGNGGGYLFRTWAPNALRISVAGSFNSYTDKRDPMVKDPSTGIWTAHIPGAVAGNEYKYLLDGATWRKDPRSRSQVSSTGNSIVYNPATYNWTGDVSFATTDIRDLVIYEAHIGTLDVGVGAVPSTFARTVSAGRLTYLQNLGINMLELMPVFEHPGTISGGYNLSDPFAIESTYGGPDALKAFVKATHQAGMGIMFDIVHNHWGAGDLDLYRYDNPGASSGGGIYFYDSPTSLAQSGFGPRPDYAEAQVRDYIKDNIAMLQDEYRADGFRWDFTKAIRGEVDGSYNITASIPDGISLLREINAPLAADTAMYSVAEDLANDSLLTTSTTNPNGLGFRAQWNINFFYSVIGELEKTSDSARDIPTLASAISSRSFADIIYIESHDEVWETNSKDRTPWRFDSTDGASLLARRKAALAAGMLMTAPAVPMIFQGSELLDGGGADHSWSDSEAIDWSRLATTNVAKFNLLYKDLISLRRNLGGATAGLKGNVTDVFYPGTGGPKVLGFSRSNGGTNPGDTVVVLMNFSSVDYGVGFTIGFPSTGTWYEQLNSTDTAYGSDFSNTGIGQTVTAGGAALHGQPTRGTVALGPYGVVILSKATPPTGVYGWMILGD